VGQTQAAFEQLLSEQLIPLRGRFKEVNIRLGTPPDAEVVPGASLLDPTVLLDHITRFGERIGTKHVAVSLARFWHAQA
jgi:hypothetical protein